MKSICGVEGVTAWGVKEGKFGLALIRAEGEAAGVFTSNLMKAPVIRLMEERIRSGRLAAVVANSGCANAYTGKRGYSDAREMAAIAAESVGVSPGEVGVASTGVIGRYLDLPLIRDQCHRVAPLLSRSEEAETRAARAIMTTDLTEKHALVRRETFSVGGITKGSGMIAPNMGTMLAFIYTDAEVPAKNLRGILRDAARRTFNRVVVDGDMSTNDIALCTATGTAGRVPEKEFSMALEECCRALAIQIAMDGEGATKLLEVTVRGAPGEEEAATVARTIVSSPLVKTAVYGADPNWGRVIAAAGRAGIAFDPEIVDLWMGDGRESVPLVKGGEIVVDLARAKSLMMGKKVVFVLDLASGNGEATAWGCDLTEKYVEINGRYTT
ncbi:MAG TPA: bifunctional ornithine acetyltransferase/N-acetylglutamate synthase [Methanolinea sp.]|jgi:glutamate N-acetyltransferase/amino-acid N-acetyltransferase|nr:bifunctional ornithine acetyltransferase/N-acetylglutamate synthase [Methanolinea sp.]HQE86093.1 bifunctional ornithine acetyltransferase/N-acetylglutamate synthase [Methanolinea sp.]HQI14962.1 bifunctional ornithine acetyltransferase/N-acetylglutamate synthase [Methanolinea sp.]HQJ19147.1 bifunctional ornithine acetyltransferase/N-acetylglutamate synthase [Methanolinea sp.]